MLTLCSESKSTYSVIKVSLILRVVGLAPRIPLHACRDFFRVAWIGLAINVVSGTLLFCANSSAFLHNTAFITKLALLCAAAFVTWLISHQSNDIEGVEVASTTTRLLATLCLLLLFGAIIAGRIIGYTSVPE